MRLKKIMTRDVEVLDSDADVLAAARIMKDKKVGSIPLRDGDRLVGMITDRDIVIKVLAEGLDPENVRVSNIMTSPIVYCFEDQSLEDAAEVMEEHQIRRLPILNDEKRLVGFVSLSDIAVYGKDKKLSGKLLEAVCENWVH